MRGQENLARTVTVATSRLGHRHQRGHALAPFELTMSERDLAKDDQGPQGLLGQIVRGRHSWVLHKHQPFVAVADDPCWQGESLPVAHDPRFQP